MDYKFQELFNIKLLRNLRLLCIDLGYIYILEKGK